MKSHSDPRQYEVDEITIDELQVLMRTGRQTARSIAERYLVRIEAVDRNGPAINSVIELNPDALTVADDLDRERKQQDLRSPLHGISRITSTRLIE